MEELNNFELLTQRLLYFIGWIISRITRIIGPGQISSGNIEYKGFDSPLFYLTIGLFFAFASLHVFKRILRKD